jgi:hypothetical protein
VFRVSLVAVAVALIVIASLLAIYSYVNVAREQMAKEQISLQVVSSVVAGSANVSRLLSSLRIALVSNNKTLVEDLAKAFAGIGISELQSYSIPSIEQAFKDVNITILDLDATKAFLKNKELVKRVFWSGRIVVFITNGVVDPVEEIFKNLNRSELPLLVIPVKGVKNVNNVEIPVYGFPEVSQVVAIRIERVEKVENNKTYIGGLAPHYYVVHRAKNVREALITVLERIVMDVHRRDTNYGGKSLNIITPLMVAKAQTTYTSMLDVIYNWVEIGSAWQGGVTAGNKLETDVEAKFYYAQDRYGSRLYRIVAIHHVYSLNNYYILSNDRQELAVCAGVFDSGFNCVSKQNAKFIEYYPPAADTDGTITVTTGWSPQISYTYTIPTFITYEDPITSITTGIGVTRVSWKWYPAKDRVDGWMAIKAFLDNKDATDPTYVGLYFYSIVRNGFIPWFIYAYSKEATNFALYSTNWQWYGSIFEVKS